VEMHRLQHLSVSTNKHRLGVGVSCTGFQVMCPQCGSDLRTNFVWRTLFKFTELSMADWEMFLFAAEGGPSARSSSGSPRAEETAVVIWSEKGEQLTSKSSERLGSSDVQEL
jgi:hypothetical protein